MNSFDGKVAVITGATGAVGRAVALDAARDGAVVCLVGRNAEKLDSVCRELEATGGQAIPFLANFTRNEDVRRLANEIEERFRQVDVLVHCAGTMYLSDIAESSIEDLDLQYQVNVRAPFALTKALLPLIRRCAGQIVFVNSSAGLTARSKVSQYAATKHALKAVADSLREEVNSDGVRVLNVFLGRTASSMQEFVHRAEGKVYHPDRLMQPADVATMIIHTLRLSRSAEVTEIRIRPLLKPAD